MYIAAKALQYLNILGIVHRDIKPANILVILSSILNDLSSTHNAFLHTLTKSNNCVQIDKDFHPHLADFGLAMYQKDIKHVSVENWRSSGKPTGGFHKKNMVGTLIYMAPEILRKDIHTEKSDVYSFAISIK
jgi:serine/threonine protein kinase